MWSLQMRVSHKFTLFVCQVAEAEEVSIDTGANMRPVFIKTEAGVEAAEARPISPGSVRLASLGAWDTGAGAKSPSLYAPPDMNSEL